MAERLEFDLVFGKVAWTASGLAELLAVLKAFSTVAKLVDQLDD